MAAAAATAREVREATFNKRTPHTLLLEASDGRKQELKKSLLEIVNRDPEKDDFP